MFNAYPHQQSTSKGVHRSKKMGAQPGAARAYIDQDDHSVISYAPHATCSMIERSFGKSLKYAMIRSSAVMAARGPI